MVLEQLDNHMQNYEIGPITHNIYKLNSMDQRWKVRTKPINLLEENIGVNFCDLGFGSDFLNVTSKAQATGLPWWHSG